MPREMTFNEVSLPLSVTEDHLLYQAIKDFATTVSILIQRRFVSKTLRLVEPVTRIEVAPGALLYDLLIGLQRAGGRDEALLILRLAHKVPITEGLDDPIVDNFRGCDCEDMRKTPFGLLLCAITGFISVSFPSSAYWDRDRLDFSFQSLDGNGEIVPHQVSIDNVARPSHSVAVIERARELAVDALSTRSFWEQREAAFSSLEFGPDVREQVLSLDEATFSVVAGKLKGLDESLVEWRACHAPFPSWRSLVTDESDSTLRSARTRSARTFRSVDGGSKLFAHHARYGSSGRIHFFIDEHAKRIEVGYIGPHLPLE